MLRGNRRQRGRNQKIERVTYQKSSIKNGLYLLLFHSNGLNRVRHPIIGALQNNASVQPVNSSTEAVLLVSPTVLGETDPYSFSEPILRAKAVNDEENL